MKATLTCTDVQANGAGTLRQLTAAYGSLRQLTATLKPGLMAKAASGTLKNGFRLNRNGCGIPVLTVQASGTSSLRHLTATLKPSLMDNAASGTLKNGFRLNWNGCGILVPTVQASGTDSLWHLKAPNGNIETGLNSCYYRCKGLDHSYQFLVLRGFHCSFFSVIITLYISLF